MSEITKQFMNGRFELMAMQSLLHGLTYAAERMVDTLNEARQALSLPLMRLAEDGYEEPTPPASSMALANGHEATDEDGSATKKKKKRGRPRTSSRIWSKRTKQRIGDNTRERWDVVKAAGISNGKAPSAAMVERAKKILARREAKAAAAVAA